MQDTDAEYQCVRHSTPGNLSLYTCLGNNGKYAHMQRNWLIYAFFQPLFCALLFKSQYLLPAKLLNT